MPNNPVNVEGTSTDLLPNKSSKIIGARLLVAALAAYVFWVYGYNLDNNQNYLIDVQSLPVNLTELFESQTPKEYYVVLTANDVLDEETANFAQKLEINSQLDPALRSIDLAMDPYLENQASPALY